MATNRWISVVEHNLEDYLNWYCIDSKRMAHMVITDENNRWIGVVCHWGDESDCGKGSRPLHTLQVVKLLKSCQFAKVLWWLVKAMVIIMLIFCKTHLESEHGGRLARVEQEEGRSVRLSQVVFSSSSFSISYHPNNPIFVKIDLLWANNSV